MSSQSRIILLRHSLVACICAFERLCNMIKAHYAENVASFESALAKVQSYQTQDKPWQQVQQISD